MGPFLDLLHFKLRSLRGNSHWLVCLIFSIIKCFIYLKFFHIFSKSIRNNVRIHPLTTRFKWHAFKTQCVVWKLFLWRTITFHWGREPCESMKSVFNLSFLRHLHPVSSCIQVKCVLYSSPPLSKLTFEMCTVTIFNASIPKWKGNVQSEQCMQ